MGFTPEPPGSAASSRDSWDDEPEPQYSASSPGFARNYNKPPRADAPAEVAKAVRYASQGYIRPTVARELAKQKHKVRSN